MQHLHRVLLVITALEILLLGYSIGLRHDEIHWVLILWDSCLIATTAAAAALACRMRFFWVGPVGTSILEVPASSRAPQIRAAAPPAGTVGIRPSSLKCERN